MAAKGAESKSLLGWFNELMKSPAERARLHRTVTIARISDGDADVARRLLLAEREGRIKIVD